MMDHPVKNLPPFVGRKQELAQIQTRLHDPACRLLTLTGLGGSGKTRLAIEVAHAVASHFQHGVTVVSLQSIPRSDLLVHAIAQGLGLIIYGEDSPETQIINYLQEKSLLLLLDNFEHLLPGAELISAILAHTSHVKILVTSTEALNLQEEWLYQLAGMSFPSSAYATELEDYESVQLFLFHARRIQPGFNLEQEHESVIVICRMAAGLPLAIELATSWLKGLTASQIAAEVHNNVDILSTTSRNVEERHRSMRAVFDHSWKLLSDNERIMFARLSVFRGSFDYLAAEQIVGAPLFLIAALVEKSLVQHELSNRFSIHELLRQYAMEKLEAYGEAETTYTRHSQYFAQLLLRYETALKQPQQPETIQVIELDLDNILLAWRWSAANQQVTFLNQMVNGLYLFGFLSSHHLEIIELFKQTLVQSSFEAPLMGRLLARRWGFLQWWYQTDYHETLSNLEHALAIAQAENNRFELAFGHLMIAYTLVSMERNVNALSHLETSKVLFESLDEPFYVSWVLSRLAFVYFNLNDYGQAMAYTQESLAIAQTVRNRFVLLIDLYQFGLGSILAGDYVNGKHFATEALQCATELGQPCQIAHALSVLALGAFCQGDLTTCYTLAARAWALVKDIILLIFQPQSLSLLILLACLREDYAEGVRLKELGIHHGTNITDLQLRYWSLAMLWCGLGNRKEVRFYIEKILELTKSAPHYAMLAWITPAAVYVLAQTKCDTAVELLSWVNPDQTLDWFRQWSLFHRLKDQLQAALGADEYQQHWENGKALTFDAVNICLRREFFPVGDTGTDSTERTLLTPRETEILRLMAAGLTNPQIADELVIGAGTVKTHTLNIYRKLEIANRTQAIMRAQELGLLPPPGKKSTTISTDR